MSKAKRIAQAIKLNGRKYLVIQQVANRVGNETHAVRLLKRPGKVQWFTHHVANLGQAIESGNIERHRGFWEALAAYDKAATGIGVELGGDRPDVAVLDDVSPEDTAKLVALLEGRGNE